MKVTAQDLKALGVIDTIVPEPLGGAQRDPKRAIAALGDAIAFSLGDLDKASPAQLLAGRRKKFLTIGRL